MTTTIPVISDYPGGPPGVHGPPEVVETHTSILIFIGDLVYKLKKAVDFGFLDFRDRDTRRAACEAEVALNGRLAPDVYLGVVDLLGSGSVVWDSLVVMRRMPDTRRLSNLVTAVPPDAGIEAGLRALGHLIADFHGRCANAPDIAAAADPAALQTLWRDNLAVLHKHSSDVLDSAMVAEIERLAMRYLAGREPLLRRRQQLGMIRDGHGDLQADDIFMLDDGPRVLDCLEFSEELRHGDVLLTTSPSWQWIWRTSAQATRHESFSTPTPAQVANTIRNRCKTSTSPTEPESAARSPACAGSKGISRPRPWHVLLPLLR